MVRPWYYASLTPFIWLANARVMCRMRPPLLTVFSGGVLFLSACLWFVTLHSSGWGNHPRLEVANTLAKELPRGSSIGIFNAGTIAYFDEDDRIVNLDGLVNNQAYTYIRKLDLCGYIVAAHLDAFGDDTQTLEAWKPVFGAKEHSCFGSSRSLSQTGSGHNWVLYQVNYDREN
jgi:hypothetical protein